MTTKMHCKSSEKSSVSIYLIWSRLAVCEEKDKSLIKSAAEWNHMNWHRKKREVKKVVARKKNIFMRQKNLS